MTRANLINEFRWRFFFFLFFYTSLLEKDALSLFIYFFFRLGFRGIKSQIDLNSSVGLMISSRFDEQIQICFQNTIRIALHDQSVRC